MKNKKFDQLEIPIDYLNEQYILGLVFNFKSMQSVFFDVVKYVDFLDEINRSIAWSIIESIKKGKDITPEILKLTMIEHKDKSASLKYMYVLMKSHKDNEPSVKNFKDHICKLKNDSIKKRLRDGYIKDLGNLLRNPHSSIVEIIKKVDLIKGEIELSIDDKLDIYNNQDMLREYLSYLKSLKNNQFKTGIEKIDQCIRGVAGGEVLTIIARAGSFKTAFLQNLLMNYIEISTHVAIFFSIEMTIPSITERYLSMSSGKTGREVEKVYQDSTLFTNNMRKKFLKDYEKLYIVTAKVSLDDIQNYILKIERKYNVVVGLIGIDYLGLMSGMGRNEYEIMSTLSKNVKHLAKKINLPIILISQVNRQGGSGTIPITLEMGRGTGAIEESADFMIGLWQSKNDQKIGYDLIGEILKNRKGPVGKRFRFDLDIKTLKIGKSASEDRQRYKRKGERKRWGYRK